ncbi:D-TA family PLP-dependent enzyme [candidate division KSB1 bacterium]|nr:D-TA family PLP-dependent enzyme [candidate division KSB1 bacterium]NIR69134.1 D-TA family PLP-dependent enzyme [candidate division KSB1 bacterium]NIS25645.1 D-TA family PLP-dependent enzyme [candidate division KSB1 bacterium]NIT72513.1 D-TA family PLP-dependent enzyme [candidate division KSB1 bacterium]NIU26322.1 D-TA family PLP-dependent enzyme [candidate division KSB1 bacterium]
MHYQELDTPALLIDLDRMEANLNRMASVAKKCSVDLRPHTKTHKCPEIAKMQSDAGAVGITCAKLGEAEVMAEAGLDDILIANEIIGTKKFERLKDLSKKARLCVAVDSIYGAESLNAALEQDGQTLDVVIEINCGQNRAGLLPGKPALDLAQKIGQLKHVNLRGLMTHGGHSYNESSKEGIQKIGQHEGSVMVETAELLRKNGIEVETVSTGSTPTAQYCGSVDGVTEIRPGTYIFYDLTQIDLFACALKDCALFVLATVTSHPAPDRIILDAGKKALTSDPASRSGGKGGYGFLPEKNSLIRRLSEEHGIIESDAEFEIGEKVRIIPNHACVVVNMFDEMYGIRNSQVEKVFTIEGRGRML